MNKVDVIINVCGKPWHTLCTLKSLMKVSGKHIDKIYFIEESHQPYNDSVKFVLPYFDNLIHYVPENYALVRATYGVDLTDDSKRFAFRYQYGIEKSDKNFVFITHNDVVFFNDLIGNMMSLVGDYSGIGMIGQCWNCPPWYDGKCSGERYLNYDPTFDEINDLVKKYPPNRGQQFINSVSKERVMPLPECRLNEFACLINNETTRHECVPVGLTPLFGSYDGSKDLACEWFRSLTIKGHKFKNYDINLDSNHEMFHPGGGNGSFHDRDKYLKSEMNAKKYFEENFI